MKRLIFLSGVASAILSAAIVDPFYAGSYSLTSLGSAPGVATNYGGLTTLAGNPNVLLLGSQANSPGATIQRIALTRDAGMHITGFSGSSTLFSTSPNIDGGLAYGPSDVLFFTGYNTHQLGQIKPGSTTPDKTTTVTGIGSSVGSVAFVPPGFTNAGQMVLLSYTTNEWRRYTLSPDGNGTFDFTAAGSAITLSGGLEGAVFVPVGSALFPNPSVLVAEYSSGAIVSYELDANGDPVVATRKVFISGLTGAEGAFLDPLTNDFLFSTFGGGNQVLRVGGFSAPVSSVPEPSSVGGILMGLVAVAWRLRRRV